VGRTHLVKNLAANRIESRSLGFQNHLVLERRMQSLSAPRTTHLGEPFWQIFGTPLESVAVSKGGKLNAGNSSGHH